MNADQEYALNTFGCDPQTRAPDSASDPTLRNCSWRCSGNICDAGDQTLVLGKHTTSCISTRRLSHLSEHAITDLNVNRWISVSDSTLPCIRECACKNPPQNETGHLHRRLCVICLHTQTHTCKYAHAHTQSFLRCILGLKIALDPVGLGTTEQGIIAVLETRKCFCELLAEGNDEMNLKPWLQSHLGSHRIGAYPG